MNEVIIKNIIFQRDLKSDEQIVKDEILKLLWEVTGDNNRTIPDTLEITETVGKITECLSLEMIATTAELIVNLVNEII